MEKEWGAGNEPRGISKVYRGIVKNDLCDRPEPLSKTGMMVAP